MFRAVLRTSLPRVSASSLRFSSTLSGYVFPKFPRAFLRFSGDSPPFLVPFPRTCKWVSNRSEYFAVILLDTYI